MWAKQGEAAGGPVMCADRRTRGSTGSPQETQSNPRESCLLGVTSLRPPRPPVCSRIICTLCCHCLFALDPETGTEGFLFPAQVQGHLEPGRRNWHVA